MISRSVFLASAVFAVLACSAFASPRVGGEEARSTSDILDALSHYIQRNEVSLDLPVADTKVTISSRNLQNDEVDFKVKFNASPVESRKSKLKKVAVPISTFILLKVITLVPLGLGILGIKAFNALQLSFFSFVISVGLAVFQLCRKLADHPTTIAAPGPWDTRNFAPEVNEPAQDIAYNAYKLYL